MPACGLANDLLWAEERSAVALPNYVPRTPAEAAQIARLGAGRIVSCPSDDSSTSAEEEGAWHSDTPSTNLPTDIDCEAGDESEDRAGGQTRPGDEAETDQWRCPHDWEAVMEEAEGLTYDDPRSDSDATITGVDGSQGPELSSHDKPADSPPNTPRSLAPHLLGSPMEHMLPLVPTVASVDMVEVHVTEEELDKL